MRTCKKCDIPLHIRTIWKGKHPGGGRFSCKIRRKWTAPAPADHHRHHLTTTRTATRGRFTNRKGKAFSPCYATLLPAYTFPFPAPYPCRIPVFGLVSTQTGGRGGGFETGSKKTKRSKGRGRKIKISAGASAIYVRGRYGLCAAVVRWWRHGVDTDVIWG